MRRLNCKFRTGIAQWAIGYFPVARDAQSLGDGAESETDTPEQLIERQFRHLPETLEQGPDVSGQDSGHHGFPRETPDYVAEKRHRCGKQRGPLSKGTGWPPASRSNKTTALQISRRHYLLSAIRFNQTIE